MLQRVDELLGFTIDATDGDIGRVRDLYFDDHRWTLDRALSGRGQPARC